MCHTVLWPSGLVHWTQVLVALVSLIKTLNHNCFVLRMGRKVVGPVCCVMHVKEPRTLIVKEKGLAPVFLDSRLEHPAGWIRASYKSYHYHYYYYYTLVRFFIAYVEGAITSLCMFCLDIVMIYVHVQY